MTTFDQTRVRTKIDLDLFSLENGLEAMRCGADVEICKKLRVSGIRIQVTSNMIVAEGV